MEINRAQRDAARHKKTEAVDSFVEHQKDEPVHSYSGSNKTLYRSGVVVRNDKKVGHEAMQRARELLSSVNGTILSKPRTLIGTNDTWFKNHQLSVERQIGERISVDKNPQVQREEMPDNARFIPIVDGDAEFYVPKSER